MSLLTDTPAPMLYAQQEQPCTVKLKLWPFKAHRPDAALDKVGDTVAQACVHLCETRPARRDRRPRVHACVPRTRYEVPRTRKHNTFTGPGAAAKACESRYICTSYQLVRSIPTTIVPRTYVHMYI